MTEARSRKSVEKRYAQLTNQLANEFVDIVGKHVQQQLGKTISSSKPKLTTQPTVQGAGEVAVTNLKTTSNPNIFLYNDSKNKTSAFYNDITSKNATVNFVYNTSKYEIEKNLVKKTTLMGNI